MKHLKPLIKNVTYTVSANLILLSISTLVTLFLPKIIGAADYGYYQLYLFYTSYVGFLHFGWCDGIYLKYSGEEYESLNKNKFKGQFYSLFFLELFLSVLLIVIIFFNNNLETNKKLVLLATSLNILIANTRVFILYILQATNRMKDYSIITVFDRIVFVILLLLLLLFKFKFFIFFVLADLLSKIISLIFSIYNIKDILFYKGKIVFDFQESINNIKIGINLMFANIASSLIIGIVRYGIQYEWDVSTFGKISLTLSISSLVMVFINAISLAFFPALKKIKEEKYLKFYNITRNLFVPLVLILLVAYYPIRIFLDLWLPNYSESVKYMPLIFPIVVFECKMSLLNSTFLKALREEKKILFVNVLTAIISLFSTFILVYFLKSLFLTMISIVVLLAIRSTLSELILTRKLGIKTYYDILCEFILIFVFIYCNWKLSMDIAFLIYIIFLLCYLVINKKKIKNAYNLIIYAERS